MFRKTVLAFLPLALLIAVPLVLRPTPADAPGGELKLHVISPHNESIRFEFTRGFQEYYQREHGVAVDIVWLAPGGTSDIVRFINDQYRTAFKRHWTARGNKWDETVARAFNNRRLAPDDPEASDLERQARREFLESNVGIGIDLFFGGGQYEMDKQAGQGHAVDAGIAARHRYWFTEPIIPQQFSGETFYDSQGRYYGACLAAFGICYNVDRLQLLPDPTPPKRWEDLGATRFFNQVAVADPTKSGSITKCFEMLIQEQMAASATAAGNADAAALDLGWARAMNLIKRIGGNARYVTDSASKVPHDVGKGDTIVGMCIDFYGRSQADWTGYQSGAGERVVYVTPEGGSSISADPILLLRGAPQRELAVDFIEFVLSKEGQKLWNYRIGAPGGPHKYAIRRLPVRRDMFGAKHRPHMSDAGQDPFAQAAGFEYRGRWTGPYFGLIRTLIKTMILDPGPELRQAWGAIVAAGGPQVVPAAMAEFNRLPFSYADCRQARARLSTQTEGVTPLRVLQAQREWTEFFRARYRRAAELAREDAP